MSDRWTDRLSEYLDGGVEAAERAELEAHLADCEECAATLEQLLDTTSNLNVDVDIKNIFISLMEKLSKFAASSSQGASNDGQSHMMSSINKDLDIFRLFKKYTDKIIDEQGKNMEVSKLLELEVAFMNFCIKTYP